MSTIDTSYSSLGLAAASSYTGSTSESTESLTGLTFTDYMSLFLTELENQDPTEPMSTTEMIQQTYYFSQLELSTQTNEYLESLLESQDSVNRLSATQLIGHSVLTDGNSIEVSNESATSINFELDEAAENVEIEIYDEDWNLVDTISLEDLSSGDHEVTWDGMDSEGNPAGDGDYTFTVSASDTNGQSVDVTTWSNLTIKSVSIKSGEIYLETAGGRQLDLDDIVKLI